MNYYRPETHVEANQRMTRARQEFLMLMTDYLRLCDDPEEAKEEIISTKNAVQGLYDLRFNSRPAQ